MDVTTMETLKDEYPTSSWALWSSDFPEDGCIEETPAEFYEFIKYNRDRLRPSVVLLSLNPSTELPSEYQNFHSTEPKHRNDQFRDFVEEADLEGSYMTDLVERIVDADSGNVDPISDDVENFLQQLNRLDQETYHILCYHEKVFQTLMDFCDSRSRELDYNIRAFHAVQESSADCPSALTPTTPRNATATATAPQSRGPASAAGLRPQVPVRPRTHHTRPPPRTSRSLRSRSAFAPAVRPARGR